MDPCSTGQKPDRCAWTHLLHITILINPGSHIIGHCTHRIAVMAQRKRVLISNDDGINAPGLLALVQALVADGLYDVCVCGPADEQVSSCPSSSPRAQSQFTKFCRLLSSEAWCGNRAAALLREPSAVCWSSAPQALTSFAGVQSAKSHAITLGRPLVSYPIEVPQTAEAYAVRVPLHVSQLRTALSAGASTRMHDLACT